MPKLEKNKTWIRLAGNASQIKSGNKHRWRLVIGGREEVWLTDWRIVGVSSERNFRPGTNSDGDKFHYIAWIDMYGDLVIDEHEIAHINLQDPPAGP